MTMTMDDKNQKPKINTYNKLVEDNDDFAPAAYDTSEDIENIPFKIDIQDNTSSSENENNGHRTTTHIIHKDKPDSYSCKRLMGIVTFSLLLLGFFTIFSYFLLRDKLDTLYDKFLTKENSKLFHINNTCFIIIWFAVHITIFTGLMRYISLSKDNDNLYNHFELDQALVKTLITRDLGHSYWVANIVSFCFMITWLFKPLHIYGINLILGIVSSCILYLLIHSVISIPLC